MVSDRPARLDESNPRTGVVILFPRARPGRLSTMRRIFLDRRNGGLRLYLCGDLQFDQWGRRCPGSPAGTCTPTASRWPASWWPAVRRDRKT